MLGTEQAWKMLNEADLVYSEEAVLAAMTRMAGEISAVLSDKYPLVLAVMGGSVYFAGHLLPRLHFPIEFDFIHASRYGDAITGGGVTWRAAPRENVVGRVVLVLDDILDGGDTMYAIKQRILELGAAECHTAVLTDKDTGIAKPIRADFVGLTIPNRFVFGCGMDAHGAWRNLPAIYAMKGT
jgi:hypoxanthine phosphoribosyltransferase